MAKARKKIKLVVSDFHLGLGDVLDLGRLNPLEEFHLDEKFAEFLRHHSTGKYAEHDVELILNGDIFNFFQVDHQGRHLATDTTEKIILEKIRRITAGHAVFFDALKAFAARPHRAVSYVVGNHDQGMLWPKSRALLNERLNAEVLFKSAVYDFDGVHVEHGHLHEAANRFDPRKFYLERKHAEPILKLPLGSLFFVEFVLKIKEHYPHVDKIRPFSRMMRWALVNETWFTLKGLFSLFRYFFSAALTDEPHRSFSAKAVLKVMVECAVFPDLSGAARRILRNDRVHTVVFGHTHIYEHRRWGGDKEYFNTGTWTDMTSLEINSLGRTTKLTYVLFEYPEADGGRPRGLLKEWHGRHRIEEDVVLS
jgi:UDP-2,3-diacylglucosamine pyrophosphatase LpxH